MKKVKNYFIVSLVSFFTLLALISHSFNCHGQSDELNQVRELMKKEIEFWNHHDIDAFVNLYAPTDSVRMLYNGGAAYGKENIMAFYKKYWPKEKMGTLSFTDVKLERLSDEYYFTSGHFHVIGPDGKNSTGRFSGLFRKIKGRWYIYTDHS